MLFDVFMMFIDRIVQIWRAETVSAEVFAPSTAPDSRLRTSEPVPLGIAILTS